VNSKSGELCSNVIGGGTELIRLHHGANHIEALQIKGSAVWIFPQHEKENKTEKSSECTAAAGGTNVESRCATSKFFRTVSPVCLETCRGASLRVNASRMYSTSLELLLRDYEDQRRELMVSVRFGLAESECCYW
jgi:hypothetical protein